MEEKEYTEELLKVAFAAMVCDGDIHADEEKMLRGIEKEDFYFKDFDLEQTVDQLKADFEERKLEVPTEINRGTYHLELNHVQRIKMLEVAIGIVRADRKIEQAEIEFINKLIINLQVSKQLVNERFGNWEILDID